MKDYFRNWSLRRIIHLAFGILISLQGIQEREWMIVMLGGLFVLMPLMNIGCFSASCNAQVSKNNNKIEDTTYEEVR